MRILVKSDTMIGYILISIGFLFAIIGIVLFCKKTPEKENQVNKIKLLGMEAELHNSTLVIFIVGVVLLVTGAKFSGGEEKPNEPITEAKLSKSITPEESNKIKELINDYYESCKNEDYQKLSTFYNSTLKRYFNKYDITSEEVIQTHTEYNNKHGILSTDYSIDWSSLVVDKVSGFYDIKFNLDYSMITVKKNTPSHYYLIITMRLNDAFRIVRIYEVRRA